MLEPAARAKLLRTLTETEASVDASRKELVRANMAFYVIDVLNNDPVHEGWGVSMSNERKTALLKTVDDVCAAYYGSVAARELAYEIIKGIADVTAMRRYVAATFDVPKAYRRGKRVANVAMPMAIVEAVAGFGVNLASNGFTYAVPTVSAVVATAIVGLASAWMADSAARKYHRDIEVLNAAVKATLAELVENDPDAPIMEPDAAERHSPQAAVDEDLPRSITYPAPMASATTRISAVHDAVKRLDDEWLEYTLDLEAYFLTKPTLRDPSVRAVHVYQDALFTLRELADDLGESPSDEELTAAENAADIALAAWDVANDHALSVGVTELSPVERNALRRIHGLAAQLCDTSTPAEMWSSLTRAIRREMDKLVTVKVDLSDLNKVPMLEKRMLAALEA